MASARIPRRERPFRGVALGVVGLGLVLVTFAGYVLLRPVYWRLYAEVIHRYEPDPIASGSHPRDTLPGRGSTFAHPRWKVGCSAEIKMHNPSRS